LTGLFWDAVDNFAGLFNGFGYIFTGEGTSKADKFDDLCSVKILSTPRTQKGSEIWIKRPELQQTPQTKEGAIKLAWRMSLLPAAMLER